MLDALRSARDGPLRARRRSHLLAWMFLAIGAVTGFAWWDSRRESEAILADLGRQQAVVASVVAPDLRAHLATVERDAVLASERGPGWSEGRYRTLNVRTSGAPRAPDPSRLLLTVPIADGRWVDVTLGASELLGSPPVQPSDATQLLLVRLPSETALHAGDGRVLASAPIREALDRGEATVRLNRSEAAALGLMPRTAMAGLTHVDAGPLGRWGVVAVATAAPQRDRETRAFWRFLLGVAMATGLVLTFGGVALRNQRSELEAQQQLAIAHVERESEDRLARAERMATMGTFAMGVVHEVSTPLGVIIGRAEQIGGRPDQDDRDVRAAQAIIGQVDRIRNVIRRFLDMARGGPPSLARTHPGDVVRSAAASVEHRFAKAGVALSIDVVANAAEILCDRALLEQAMVNLLLNACDACAPGGHVEISTRSDAQEVVFVVTDDGVGISPEVAARAKESFFTTKAAGSGTGLGLAITSEIAKSHRGELTISPNGERGTRACIEIPVAMKAKIHAHG
ncbi:MAG: HAMP domain-containing sensor histidine kinase [Polyangiaceae bacterium]